MNIITILGSPKKHGKTAEALGLLEENLALQGHDIERVSLGSADIHGCVGCYACMSQNEGPSCVFKDDAISIFEKMINAEIIVYTSPIYCYDFTSQMKTLIDRHFCLTVNFGSKGGTSSIAGKKVALLVTCMDGIEGNAEYAEAIFDKSMSQALKCTIVGKEIIPFSNQSDFSGRAKAAADRLSLKILDEKLR